MISQPRAVALWKGETSDGKQREIPRSINNLFLSCHFFSLEGLVRKSKITGTLAENVDIYSVHPSLGDPFVPSYRRIRKG